MVTATLFAMVAVLATSNASPLILTFSSDKFAAKLRYGLNADWRQSNGQADIDSPREPTSASLAIILGSFISFLIILIVCSIYLVRHYRRNRSRSSPKPFLRTRALRENSHFLSHISRPHPLQDLHHSQRSIAPLSHSASFDSDLKIHFLDASSSTILTPPPAYKLSSHHDTSSNDTFGFLECPMLAPPPLALPTRNASRNDKIHTPQALGHSKSKSRDIGIHVQKGGTNLMTESDPRWQSTINNGFDGRSGIYEDDVEAQYNRATFDAQMSRPTIPKTYNLDLTSQPRPILSPTRTNNRTARISPGRHPHRHLSISPQKSYFDHRRKSVNERITELERAAAHNTDAKMQYSVWPSTSRRSFDGVEDKENAALRLREEILGGIPVGRRNLSSGGGGMSKGRRLGRKGGDFDGGNEAGDEGDIGGRTLSSLYGGG